MALGSEVDASNPTFLSKNPFFQYHYSSNERGWFEVDRFGKAIIEKRLLYYVEIVYS